MAQVQPSFLPDLQSEEAASPLMAQYLALKSQHQDCLLFFRLGDFYELFFEDAVQAARVLDIVLTRRGQMNGQDIPMCGVPAHAYESYLAKLIRNGFRVALCEQKETPEDAKRRSGKSIIVREVVRIITPGTLTEDSLLDAHTATYLACVADIGEDIAISWLDLVSGQPLTQRVTGSELSGALARIDPSEILLPQRLIDKPALSETLQPWKNCLVPQPNSRFDSDNARRRLQAIYHVSELVSFGDFSRAEIAALGALLDYAALTQKSDLKHLARPKNIGTTQIVAIDPATRRNLELTRTMSGERAGSLLATIDRTMTGAGARLLAARVVAPVTAVDVIYQRLDGLEYVVKDSDLREKLRAVLRQSPDLERALARLTLGRGGPRDLAAVRDAVHCSENIHSYLLTLHADVSSEGLPQILRDKIETLGKHHELRDRLTHALAADLPLLVRDGNFIARGYAASLDELVILRDDSRRLIAGLQLDYANKSGVSNLKIRHNQVIGYYIEVTPSHADKLLANKDVFIHRQSLASAVRFTTVELSELERKITEAADKALAIEIQLFAELVQEVLQRLSELRLTAEALAELDVITALAALAVEQNYTRPLVDDSLVFNVTAGRHPVVEQALKNNQNDASFIANDCCLDHGSRLWLVTGPNMAGKSTFLRQNAVIALLAQMGSFVPAVAAHIGMVDRLFSRVGAADDLARGRSTFMVEMVETAAILNQAGERALVILDEIGRGTATFDGLSIAWATIEHLHDVNRCRSLFATHYHELTSLTGKLQALRCYTMKIKEWDNEIIFLHEIVSGVADRSYGIHVAQMAGLPSIVIDRAKEVLTVLESDNDKSGGKKLSKALLPFNAVPVMSSPIKVLKPELDAILASLKPDELTPREALEMLYKIKKLSS
jgi:DNA mismatch repair protein MutS